ncbi:MAG TPA: hypothetical protein VGD05_02310 [Pyrinomonadaceae bacterium]|jgi:hypothetical protein
MSEKLPLRFLADNFDFLVKDKIDSAPYAGYIIRFTSTELKLIQDVRDHLNAMRDARMRGGEKSKRPPIKNDSKSIATRERVRRHRQKNKMP